MNLDNEIVIHKVFWEGSILQLTGDRLTVSFISGEKKFIFPDAFNGFLMAKNPLKIFNEPTVPSNAISVMEGNLTSRLGLMGSAVMT